MSEFQTLWNFVESPVSCLSASDAIVVYIHEDKIPKGESWGLREFLKSWWTHLNFSSNVLQSCSTFFKGFNQFYCENISWKIHFYTFAQYSQSLIFVQKLYSWQKFLTENWPKNSSIFLKNWVQDRIHKVEFSDKNR